MGIQLFSIKKTQYLWNKTMQYLTYVWGSIHVPTHPQVFAIESTNRCQLKCLMCPRSEMTRKIGDIEVDFFKLIIDRDCKYTAYLFLDEMGEPLLHPNILDLIEYAQKRGIKVYLTTNACALNKEISENLLKLKLERLYISFEGVNKEIYERIRRNANFEQVRVNIEYFCELKRKGKYKKPFIQIDCIELRETIPSFNHFRDYWKDKVDKVNLKSFRDWDGSIPSITELAPKIMPKPPLRERCPLPWFSVVVLWDGKVVPCCYDFDAKYVLGNLREESLEEIWNNDKMTRLREAHVYGEIDKIPLCKNCSMMGLFERRFAYLLSKFLIKGQGYLKKKRGRK